MLYGRTVLAFCTAHIQSAEVLESVQAFLAEAKTRGYYVMVFNSDADITALGTQNAISYSVYDLIPYEQTDAVVLMAETIGNPSITDKICEKAADAQIPVLSYDGILSKCPSVYCYPQDNFSSLMEHVLTIHGCRKVDLLTGIHGNYDSECMVVAYQEALANHGIPFEADRVEYGEYLEEPTVEAVERLLAYDTPEAIFCVNDAMAISACGVLRKRGLRIPEDVIVTGLDGIVRERFHTPRLTNCAKDYISMSAAAFDTLEMMLDGGDADAACRIMPIMHTSESCGCHVTEQRDQNEAIFRMYRQIQDNAKQEKAETQTLAEVMKREQPNVIDYLDLLANQMPKMAALCLRERISPDMEDSSLHQFSDTPELMSTVTVHRKEKRYAMVSRTQLIPNLQNVIRDDHPLYVTSICFRDEVFGYYVYYGSEVMTESYKLPKFVHSAGTIIGTGLYATRLQILNEKLLAARTRDSLTGMLNLNGALKSLTERISRADNADSKLTLAVIGLKNLRQINSIFGHMEGDQALLSLANAISDCVDSDVTTAKIGGDEFLVAFLQDATLQLDPLGALLTVLKNRLHSFNQVSNKSYSIEIAVGKVSAQISPTLSLQAMLNEAIAIKDESHNNLLSEDGHTPRVSLSDPLAAQVEEILNKNLLTYHFQPIVSSSNGQIYAYEALMRTTSEQRITPLTVLQYATIMGRLYDVEWLTYCNVLRIIRENESQFNGKKVFINSIPGHFIVEHDFQHLKTQYSDLLPSLVVEFTEQAETDDEDLNQMQARCNSFNMEIAVDDYGTGYSNITNLLRYSPNYVKIDRNLISNIHEEPKKQHFVTNIIDFAHANGFLALAEGVETSEELRAVIRFGVDLIQGNYTALPAPIPSPSIENGIMSSIVKLSSEAAKQLVRKTFMANNRQTVYLDKLTAEHYTDIFIAQPYVEIIGDFNTTMNFSIKFKDGIESHVVLQDIHLCATHPFSCIVLGKHSKVTLECRGDNRMDHGGIWVPESADLHLTGRGNLSISTNDSRSCAIGSDIETCFGNLNIDLAGCLQLTVNGDQCIGIGGGTARGQQISLCGSKLFMQMSGAEGIGIGAGTGKCEIKLTGCSVNLETRIANSVAVGILDGAPNILLNTANIDVIGSGKALAVIGSLHGGGQVIIKDSTLHADLKAQSITIVGSDNGAPKISMHNTSLDTHCEGMRVLDIGSESEDADITIIDTEMVMDIRSAKMLHLAAAPDHCISSGLQEKMKVNE